MEIFKKVYEFNNTLLPNSNTRYYIINLKAECALYRELIQRVKTCSDAYEKDQINNNWHGSTKDYMRPIFDAYKSFRDKIKFYREDV